MQEEIIKDTNETVTSQVNENNSTSSYGEANEATASEIKRLPCGVNEISSIRLEFEDKLSKNNVPYKCIIINFINSEGATFTSRLLEQRKFKQDGTPNKLFLKPAVILKYIASKVQGKEIKIPTDVDSYEKLYEFFKDEIECSGKKLQIKTLPELSNDGSNKYYPSLITYAPKEGTNQWGMGWLHNLEFESPIVLSNKEKNDIEAYNNPTPASKGNVADMPF